MGDFKGGWRVPGLRLQIRACADRPGVVPAAAQDRTTATRRASRRSRELRRFEETDRRGEVQTLSNLGSAYSELRRFEEAIGCGQQALALFRKPATGMARASS